MGKTQLIGLLLCRGGLLLVAATALLEAARWVLRFVNLPGQVEFGIGMAVAGLMLVVASLILERIQDSRAEGDLHE